MPAEAQMLCAIETAQSGQVSANQAARQHGVPPSTLKDCLSGRVLHGAKPGPRPYMGPSEEKELSEYLLASAKVGYGKTRGQIKSIAESVAQEKGILKGKRILNGWWQRFLQRNPKISLLRNVSTAHVRIQAINREKIEQYYDLLEEVLEELDLDNHPDQIYNWFYCNLAVVCVSLFLYAPPVGVFKMLIIIIICTRLEFH